MAERPILFSGPMVRAILDGRKTQTRRVVSGMALEWLANGRFTPSFTSNAENRLCPYGHPGDHLWVRETWREYDRGNECPCYEWCACPPSGTLIYRASCDGGDDDKWRASIHMPRSASRITLEITDTRIERLQCISEADAIAEGVSWWVHDPMCETARDGFRAFWDSINAKRGYGWDINPLVWVVEFKVANG